jgi:hypothetical protein
MSTPRAGRSYHARMNITAFEPLLRDATVKAIDAVGKKLAGAEVTAENAVTRLLDRWNALTDEEKQGVATVIITTAATAVAAIAALKGGKKKMVKKAAKKAIRKVARKVGG